MESYLYESDPCCLCWFSTTWADLDLRTDLNSLWRQNIRVIGLPSPGDEAFLTGSGFFLDADDDIVFASHDPDVSVSYNSQSNPLAMGLPEIDVEKARDRGRVFILHDICWLMLFDCVADRQISRRPLLVKSLYGSALLHAMRGRGMLPLTSGCGGPPAIRPGSPIDLPPRPPRSFGFLVQKCITPRQPRRPRPQF